MDFCLTFVPFGHYDEPEILRYEKRLICPKGADVRHHIPTRPTATTKEFHKRNLGGMIRNRNTP